MNQLLPSGSNMEYYRKQAKNLLRDYYKHKESALLRVGRPTPMEEVKLADIQRIIAREKGYSNWSKLKLAVLEAAIQEESEVEFNPAPLLMPGEPDEPERVKQSYEGNAHVQRWLNTGKTEGKGEFNSPFLENHHERDWIKSSLAYFYGKGLIRDVVGSVKSGKEADVYRCTTDTPGEFLAAKIYRPRMFRNLQNDSLYRNNRSAGRDRRSRKAMDKLSTRGREFRMESWINFEYETHGSFFHAGVSVPKPVDCHGNAILMEYLGDESSPAPLLHHVKLTKEEGMSLFESLINDVELMFKCGRIHGDLSAYNVLYWQERAVIIDFAQAVDAGSGPDMYDLLLRDIRNLTKYFLRSGVLDDPQQLAEHMWSRVYSGYPHDNL